MSEQYIRYGIDQLGLGARARRLLFASGLLSVFEIRQLSRADLMAIRGMGAVTAQEIIDAVRIFDIGIIAWQVERAKAGQFGRTTPRPQSEMN